MSKNFNHKWAKIPKLKQINSDEGRRYLIEGTETKYPSITTVLGATSDKSGLMAWKKRVGEEQAAKVSAMATRRGTAMHSLCEQYLLNKEPKDDSIDGQMMYKAIRPYLDNIDNVRCLETPLFSHKFKVAGTVDCIAEYNGKLTIIDFKTANRPKKPEYIDGYFKQGSFYFWSYYEITGELPEQILILISVEDGTVQEFILDKKSIIKYTEQLRTNIDTYYYNLENYGIK
jgi:genome maintenance exonuclease 1